jgi:Cu/Ag efflux pump CusA
MPEVLTVHKLGRADTATTQHPNMIETTVQLRPEDEWQA